MLAMDHAVIELIEPLILHKEQCEPKKIDAGTLLKVLFSSSKSLLVADDQAFNFTLSIDDENIIWKQI